MLAFTFFNTNIVNFTNDIPKLEATISNMKENDWVLLLIDVQNTLNEKNWTAMLWSVRFDFPSGT